MYGHVITKFSRIGRLPHFLSYGAPRVEFCNYAGDNNDNDNDNINDTIIIIVIIIIIIIIIIVLLF